MARSRPVADGSAEDVKPPFLSEVHNENENREDTEGKGCHEKNATDFTFFNAQIRQASANIAMDNLDIPSGPHLSTFLDITSRVIQNESLDTSKQGFFHQSLKNLSTAQPYRPPSRANSGDLSGVCTTATTNTLLGEASRAGPGLEVHAQHMPFDWVIKRSMRLVSSMQLEICHQAFRPSLKQTSEAQCAFLEASGEGRVSSGLSPEGHLCASLLSWQFPESSWSGETVKAIASMVAATSTSAMAAPAGLPLQVAPSSSSIGGGGGVASVLWARLAAWRAALRSVYLQLRSRSCPAFYLLNQGAHPFTVLFCGHGVRGVGPEPHAIISQTSKVMRSRLTTAGVDYILPFAPLERDEKLLQNASLMRKVDDEDVDLEDWENGPNESKQGLPGKMVRAPWTSARDHSPESLVLVQGAAAVHALLDLMLNDVVGFEEGRQLNGSRDVADVPLILAPVPFERATIQKAALKVRSAPAIRPHGPSTTSTRGTDLDADDRSDSAAAAGAAGSEVRHVVEVLGPLPPWSVHRFIHAMQVANSVDLQVHLESDPSCLGLNLELPQAKDSLSDTPSAPEALNNRMTIRNMPGAWDSKELQALQASCGQLQRRVVKSVNLISAGHLLVKLS